MVKCLTFNFLPFFSLRDLKAHTRLTSIYNFRF